MAECACGVRWHCPQEGSETPIDVWLDEKESTSAKGCARWPVVRVKMRRASAAANLRCTVRIDVSKETLRGLVETEGRAVIQAMRQPKLNGN